MKDSHIYHRFQDAFADKARAAADAKPTLDHGMKRGLHGSLASVFNTVFASHVKTLEEAMARFQVILDGASEDAASEKPSK